ncbi:hypothetical protein, partial [Caballeronia telluris]|uniref:hypothetical protein n=1 Tax=Caballeronia telluris TaxID=326475 RepID=UPI000A637C86
PSCPRGQVASENHSSIARASLKDRILLNYFLGRYASLQCSMQLVLTIDGHETAYPRTDFTGAPF